MLSPPKRPESQCSISTSSSSSSSSSPNNTANLSAFADYHYGYQQPQDERYHILARYYYNCQLQAEILRQQERARLQPPSWTQRQQVSCGGIGGGISELLSAERKRYSEEQTRLLWTTYRVSKYVSREDMVTLAEESGLTSMQVKIWFQNRRLKDRKRCRDRGEKFPDPPKNGTLS